MANSIKSIFEEAGFDKVEFDEVVIKKDEIKLYLGEFYLKMWKENGEWRVWVFDRETDKKTEIDDINIRAFIDVLECELNNRPLIDN